ncbi:MAG: cytochrome c [Candidatus Protistobacter heckmanni]|nr:cytochrome c [Candidatus Protistobacter heckmanni]
MKKALVLAAALLASAPMLASAQFAKNEDAIRYRQSALTVMSRHFSLIASTVRGERPFNAAEVQANADVVAMMSHLPWIGFVAGAETKATKPEIWKDPAKFKEAADKLQTETAKLQAAAKTGELAKIRTSFGAVGQSCKACHDNFRNQP